LWDEKEKRGVQEEEANNQTWLGVHKTINFEQILR